MELYLLIVYRVRAFESTDWTFLSAILQIHRV